MNKKTSPQELAWLIVIILVSFALLVFSSQTSFVPTGASVAELSSPFPFWELLLALGIIALFLYLYFKKE